LKLWTDYWLSARDRTSSASEILHFGVFKAGAHNKVIADFDAIMTNAEMQSGFSPEVVYGNSSDANEEGIRDLGR
jgi:hypothetical protein